MNNNLNDYDENITDEKIKYYQKNRDKSLIIENDNFITYLVKKTYFTIVIPPKNISELKPNYQQLCASYSIHTDLNNFSFYSPYINIMSTQLEKMAIYRKKMEIDIYKNVKNFYRYDRLLNILKNNGIKVNTLSVHVIIITNVSQTKLSKEKIIKDESDILKIKELHKNTKITYKYHLYEEFMEKQFVSTKFVYIRYYYDRKHDTGKKIVKLLVKLLMIINNTNIGNTVILELKVNEFIFLLMDMINYLSTLFEKTLLFSHKTSSEFRIQIIFHKKNINKNINIKYPKSGYYISNLGLQQNESIKIFFDKILRYALFNNIVFANILRLNIYNDNKYHLIMEKIDHHRKYIDFKKKYRIKKLI